jgi:PD-(D/E)XK nuclease superfamily
MTAPTIIRASSLTLYPDCPRRTAARLFRREIEAAGFRLRHTPRGIGAVIGTAVHGAAAMLLDDKARHGSLAPENRATDCAAINLADELASGEVAFDTTTANRSEAMLQAVRMVRIYHRRVAPAVQPILVEERLEAEVAPGLVLSGQPDTIAREPGAIRDLKTGTRSAGTHAPQIGAYSLLARSHGLDIESATVDFVRRAPATKPQPDPISKAVAVTAAETAATNIIRHIEGDLRTFREGDPERRILPGDPWAFQANPASILCSPKFCPAFGTEFCHEGDPDKESH